MEHDIKKVWSDTAARLLSDELQFDNWFDSAEDRRTTEANATIDFYHRIMTSDVYEFLGDPRDKTCLEIGYGGGRLLDTALSVFKTAYGVDVHTPEVSDFVSSRIRSRRGDRVVLVHSNDTSKIPDQSVDFAYSFIVFQHFSSFDDVVLYVALLRRVMKMNGVARIYFRVGPKTGPFLTEFLQNERAETFAITEDDFRALLSKNDFDVIECRSIGPKKMWQPFGPKSSQMLISFKK